MVGALALLGMAALPMADLVAEPSSAAGTADSGDDGPGDATGGQAPADVDASASSQDGSEDADAARERGVWDDLADCESGDWDADGNPIAGTARWDYGLEFAHEGYEQFQGGLNFHPATWDEFRDADMPDDAGHATRAEEIVVGERVLEAQGWGAWPVCSEMLGLR